MDATRKKIKIFQDSNGNEPFTKWIKTLSTPIRARVFAKLDRVESGDKSTQVKDVKKAKKYWNEYISRRMS